MKRIFTLAGILLAVFFGSSALAADFEKELAKALINISPDASNASMGNAWVATPDFASNSAAVTAMGIFENGGVSLNYSFIDFENGPDMRFWSPSATVRLPVGVLQISYAYGESDREVYEEEYYGDAWYESGGHSYDIKFDSMKDIDVQYGLKAAEGIFAKEDKLFLGVGYNYSKSKLAFGADIGTPATSFSSSLDSENKGHTWSASAVYQPNLKVSVGAFYAHSWDKGKDKLYFEGELGEIDSYSEQSNQYRLGIGAQVTPTTFVAADYQHLDLPSGNSDQLFAGVEQAIVADWLYLYAGWAGDGPTGGVGAYFENGGINLAYMHDTNDGLDDTLGKTKIVMIAVYLNF